MRILLQELPAGVDALAAENPLVFCTGPLQGSGVAGSSRIVVVSKSPKTGTANESYVGGSLGHELGTSGFDGMIVRGCSASPSFLVLSQGQARLYDAGSLWGEPVAETHRSLIKDYPGASTACIGPAGENLVQFSCIMIDGNRAAGRPGLGAVMGSKRLKAVVVKGSIEKAFHDSARLRSLRSEFARSLAKDPVSQRLREYGTAGDLVPLNSLGILPTRNFQRGWFERAEEIGGEAMAKSILVGRDTCVGCPVRCKRRVSTEFSGQPVLDEYGGPEYETIAALGSLCMNHDLSAIALANQKCNAFGLDTISVGVLLAFMMEATEKGLLKPGLAWGDATGMLELIEKIAYRQEIGDTLAEGVAALAEDLGADFAMHTKGVEVPMHEPRGKKAMAISYATSPRGATHTEGFHDTMVENLNVPIAELEVSHARSRLSWEEKPRLQKIFEDLSSFTNSLVICRFVSFLRTRGESYPYGKLRELVAAITGMEMDAREMLLIGERNYCLRKILLAREGYTREDDDVPSRLKAPLEGGACEGEVISDEDLQVAIDEYYALRGFDNRGPTDAKLMELGLGELAGDC